MDRLKGLMLRVLFALALVGVMSLPASAQVTLPTTGVAVEDYIDAAVAALGAVAAAAIGGFVAYTILKRAIRWIKVAMT